MENTNEKNKATFTHLSTLTQYFIPFGNFIFPIIIWSSANKDSEFVQNHGKQAINFQLSLLLYTLALGLIAIPILIYSIFSNVPFSALDRGDDIFFEYLTAGNITGLVIIAIMAITIFAFMKIAEFFLIIYAAVKAANGENYVYPFTIRFIK